MNPITVTQLAWDKEMEIRRAAEKASQLRGDAWLYETKPERAQRESIFTRLSQWLRRREQPVCEPC